MNPNLTSTTGGSCTYKDLLLRKLSYAVISSVLSQIFILQLYVFATHTNPLHPIEWLLTALGTMVSLSTLVFLVPFLLIIFVQSLICAKDYVMKSSYCSTRFQKFVATFSVHNLVLALLHAIVGATVTWLFLSISGGEYQNVAVHCKGQRYCLNAGTFFLVFSGLWTGLYYFIKVYIAERNLAFPVIHQRKFLQLKCQLVPLVWESVILAFWPSLFYSVFYYFYGEYLSGGFGSFLGLLDSNHKNGVFIYVLLWFFSALYYINMNLMRFYFNLFLTEPVQFSLVKDTSGSLTLQESIINYNWPIVQNLACLDLHLLAQWSPPRRHVFFTISNPGGHPHNWNSLVESILKLFTEYTQLLNKTIDIPEKPTNRPIIQAPIIQSPDRFRNLRNMALIDHEEQYRYIDSSNIHPVEFTLPQALLEKLTLKLQAVWSFFKVITGINFLFGELPQANIRKCLANGNLIIWASQGISGIITASIEEDKFGVVQKDLPAIITSLVQLKQSLDKLNKVPALTRKMVGYDDFNYKMKGAVTGAVKRSLFNICKGFESHLAEIPLAKDVYHYLHLHIICKS